MPSCPPDCIGTMRVYDCLACMEIACEGGEVCLCACVKNYIHVAMAIENATPWAREQAGTIQQPLVRHASCEGRGCIVCERTGLMRPHDCFLEAPCPGCELRREQEKAGRAFVETHNIGEWSTRLRQVLQRHLDRTCTCCREGA